MSSAPMPWPVLSRPLAARDKAGLLRTLRALCRWQATLSAWPRLGAAPDATPFVTVYARGRVRGCYGHAEGTPGERLARAFLRAANDGRYGGVGAADREALVASVTYAKPPRALRGDEARAALEIGTHGAVLVRTGAPPVVLLPQVALDSGLDAEAFLGTLARKAGLEDDGWRDGELLLFETETVSSRDAGTPGRYSAATLASAWLARQVARDGAVTYEVDPRTGERTARGPMFHGRACTLAQALLTRDGTARAAGQRARRWLEREVRAALAGRDVEAWPDDPSMAGGTLALAVLAGIDVRAELLAFARTSDGAVASGWHAGQIALALGEATPPRVWKAAVADVARQPFAPWTLMAARRRDSAGAVAARCEAGLCEALRAGAPHAGSVAPGRLPELALTAVAVEALAPLAARSPMARAAVARGRAFLHRWQLVPGRVPAAFDPGLAVGAFPSSPIHAVLRCDVTAHGLLALG